MRIHTITFLAICLALFARAAVAQDFVTPKVDVEYDKFKDVTQVRISPVFVIKPNPTGFQFGLMGGYKGRTPIVPKNILGIFYSVSDSEFRKYEISRSVIFLADYERIKLGTATHAVDYRNGFYIEVMLIDIPFETLQKISRAKTVEAQVGGTEFVVSSTYLEAMREYAKKFAP